MSESLSLPNYRTWLDQFQSRILSELNMPSWVFFLHPTSIILFCETLHKSVTGGFFCSSQQQYNLTV